MVQTTVKPPTSWTKSQKSLAWLSFGIFCIGFVLYMVGYTGNYWYVSPVVNNRYPPDNRIAPINFGLFYMCYRGHCKFDMRQDYQIVLLLPDELGVRWAYQNYRTACMSIVTIGAVLSLLAIGCYFLFLSSLRISLIFGYVTGALQILSAIISMIGVIIFGYQFYGAVNVSPFGWSFGLTIVGILFFFVNGIVLIVHSVFIHIHVSRMRYQAAGRTQSTGFMGCLEACCRGF